MRLRLDVFTLAVALMVPGPRPRGVPPSPGPPSRYLYLWTASADTAAPDFLAVFDVEPTGDRYGRLVTTLPVPGRGNRPHHTEHAIPADRRLFANGFGSGQTFIFDLSHPTRPRLDGQFGDAGPLMHPHSFLRLPNRNLLATFQMQHDSLGEAPGGLVELTPQGKVVRSASANRSGGDRRVRPYSAAILPGMDRVVTTTSNMEKGDSTRLVQIWRLSDLALLRSIELPTGPHGEGYNTAEPRVLTDGRRCWYRPSTAGSIAWRGSQPTRQAEGWWRRFPGRRVRAARFRSWPVASTW